MLIKENLDDQEKRKMKSCCNSLLNAVTVNLSDLSFQSFLTVPQTTDLAVLEYNLHFQICSAFFYSCFLSAFPPSSVCLLMLFILTGVHTFIQ